MGKCRRGNSSQTGQRLLGIYNTDRRQWVLVVEKYCFCTQYRSDPKPQIGSSSFRCSESWWSEGVSVFDGSRFKLAATTTTRCRNPRTLRLNKRTQSASSKTDVARLFRRLMFIRRKCCFGFRKKFVLRRESHPVACWITLFEGEPFVCYKHDYSGEVFHLWKDHRE